VGQNVKKAIKPKKWKKPIKPKKWKKPIKLGFANGSD
jgi:hypothetical protein